MPAISHQTDDQLELYALGRLPEPEVELVEEHLLVCVSCQERLNEVEVFAMAMRQAIGGEPAVGQRPKWFRWLLQCLQSTLRPQMVCAVGFGALILITVLFLHPVSRVQPLALLDLAAMRGGVQRVNSARETDITLTDAPNRRGLSAQIVNSDGSIVWGGQLAANGGKLKIAKQLAPESYFVRLFDPDGKLIHEYGFLVRAAPL